MNNDNDDKNLLRFPDPENRKKRLKQKREKKEQENKEDQWRREYRAQQAKHQTVRARSAASGKTVPFINFERIPPFTRVIICLFVGIYILSAFILSPAQNLEILTRFGFVPAYFTIGPWDPVLILSPMTCLFLHGDWMHLAFNTIMMAMMGVLFERTVGTRRTIKFFFLCGLCGDLVYLALSPHSYVPVIGASGGLSGLFGASLLLLQQQNASMQVNRRFIIFWIFLIVGMGMLSPNTAWQAHLGGFLGGLGLFHLWRKGHIRL